ncbi:Multidrug resistance-associated protein 1 [Mortierella sp. AD010]|nr:Multidrug resistance-associated protein 1 [Mortierella sp. AD010]
MSTPDPTKKWVAFLVDQGGHSAVFGIPALIATVVFIGRISWLKRNKTPHNYGRTWWIYWQFFILSAIFALLGLMYSLTAGPYIASADGLLMSSFFALIAWMTALNLNSKEHRYEIRSSDYLFIYYIVALLGCALSLFILQDELVIFNDSAAQDLETRLDPPPVSDYKMDPLRFLLLFGGSVGLAFFFEILPRGCTRVQRESREKESLSSYDQANLFSRLTFHYSQRMMSLGARKTLTPADLKDPTPEELKTHVNYDIVSKTWEGRVARYNRRHPNTKSGTKNEKSPAGPSLILTVLDSYKWHIFPTMLLRLLSFALMYVPIFLFSYLLKFFTDYGEAIKNGTPPPAVIDGLLISVGIFLGNVFSALFLSMSSNDCTFMGIEARAALVAMIYRKSLKLSPSARSKSTLGEISNHMAVDAEIWMQAVNQLPLLLTIPLEISISIFLLYRLLGWSLIAGLAVFAIITPFQTKLGKSLFTHQRSKLKVMDSRLRLMTEVLSNIKIVKLQAWENAFRVKLDVFRINELAAERALATVRSFLVIVFTSVNLLIIMATFTVYSNWGGPDFTPGKMTPEVIFVGITLFTMMGRPLGLISLTASHITALRNANGRIQKFLLLEEIDTTVVERYSRQISSKDPILGADGKLLSVEIENGTFSWEKIVSVAVAPASLTPAQAERQPLLAPSSSLSSGSSTPLRPVLSNIHLQIPEGNLTAIVGRIGQGKSSLLNAIIGELYKQQGTVKVFGDLVYVPQQAWIINASVRDNILFGKPFNQEKYDHIIYASGLIPDIEMLPAGDSTEIGEKGINLSGGQKQRVSLARAAYQDADIYLLDDPLSAVDAHVDQHLWEHLIGPDGILKHKTRLLVTHGIHHLDSVDQIIVMKDGMVSETGGYRELMDAKNAFYQLISEFSVQEKKKQSTVTEDENVATKVKAKAGTDESKLVSEPAKNGKASKGGLVSAEKVEEGKIGWRVYLEYAKAISIHNAIICLFLYGFAQACQVATNFWLRHWVTADERGDSHSIAFYLSVYAALVALYLVVDVSNSYMTNVICGLQGARTLYIRLLERVLRMPMSFFDTTPMGRIINRFSTDVAAIDSQIPQSLPGLLSFASTTLSIILVISYSTPIFLIAVPPLGLGFFVIQNYYVKTSGQLKRLQSVSKSPLYQHFSESLAGVSTIRCQSGLMSQFIIENEKRSDNIVQTTNLFFLTNRWLTIRIQTLCATTVFLAAALAVLNVDKLDPSLVGLALSYALNLTNVIAILVRTLGEVENQFVSVERILEYIEKPVEAPAKTGVTVPRDWPSQGQIVFKDFSARYREGLDLCIKDASFTIEPQEKIGVVGRTGAGKSSLTLALFRIIEAADSYWARASDPSASGHHITDDYSTHINGGSIEIDGVDISTLGLQDLRKHLAIIPQDPTLFAGSVRYNLDPFHDLKDIDLWEALDRAHLKDYISSLPGGLSFEVSQNGENFSLGQRSLLCLARALLRRSKVLVLDEATASVDVETDELIQKTIRKEFRDRTVLTIAHRIKTVMDSSKILVLEKGQVKEFDTPSELIKKREESLFYRLAEQAGEI